MGPHWDIAPLFGAPHDGSGATSFLGFFPGLVLALLCEMTASRTKNAVPLVWAVLCCTLGGVACDSVAPKGVQNADVFATDLIATQIPAQWIVEGQPQSRVKQLAQADDQAVSVALWDCTAGTFKWHFGSDEMIQILSGEVDIRVEGGTTRTLRPGDIVYFQAGTNSVWHVKEYVKKLAVNRTNSESVVRRARRKLDQLLAAL